MGVPRTPRRPRRRGGASPRAPARASHLADEMAVAVARVEGNVVPRADGLEHAEVVVVEVEAEGEGARLARGGDGEVLQVERALDLRHQLLEALRVRLPLLGEDAGARVRQRVPAQEVVKRDGARPVDVDAAEGVLRLLVRDRLAERLVQGLQLLLVDEAWTKRRGGWVGAGGVVARSGGAPAAARPGLPQSARSGTHQRQWRQPWRRRRGGASRPPRARPHAATPGSPRVRAPCA